MKTGLGTLPVPLQRQILLRVGLSATSAVAGAGLLILLRSVAIAAPCLVAALLAVAGAWHIYRLSILGRCLVLKGTVLNTEMSALRRRPKALLLEVDGIALRVVLRSRFRTPETGSIVKVYISDNTPLYDWRGMHQLQSYLALEAEGSSIGD